MADATKRRLVIPGGNGFCGRVLANWFMPRDWDVTILSRRPHYSQPGTKTVAWDGKTVGAWVDELDGADAIVNMAGRSVNCRYGPANREEILRSRIESTTVVGKAIAQCANPPRIWLNSSTATIYRHAEDRPQEEATGELGSGFSVNVATAWEKAFMDAAVPYSVRKVALRSAMVLGNEKGTVFDVLCGFTRKGLGGKMGSGRQRVSWIHEHDFARAVEFLIAQDDISGLVNVSAPKVPTNAELMKTLRTLIGIPVGLPATRWMLEIGAVFLRTETELILKSRWVVPARLEKAGFSFLHADFPSAASELLARQ
jgi:uncharacterized protein